MAQKLKIPAKAKNAKLENSPKFLAAGWTLALIAAALAIIVISPFIMPRSDFHMPGERELGRPDRDFTPPQDQNWEFFSIRFGLSALNVLLAIYLLYVYVKDYLKLRTSFTLGIVAFLFSFLLYALSSLPLVHLFFGPYDLARVFSFVPMIFSAIGLLIFAKVSNE